LIPEILVIFLETWNPVDQKIAIEEPIALTNFALKWFLGVLNLKQFYGLFFSRFLDLRSQSDFLPKIGFL